VVLVSRALPGELVRIDTLRTKKDLVRAAASDVVEPSENRVTPLCPYFGKCGGCQYQHATYSYQLEQKREILAEVLARVGKIAPPPAITIESGPEWNYRNRVQLHLEGKRIGFHAAGTHLVTAVDQCVVSSPKLNEAIAALRQMTHSQRWPGFLKSIELFTNEEEVQINVLDSGPRYLNKAFFEWCEKSIPGANNTALDYAAAGQTFRVSHKSFFQVNRFLIERLVDISLRTSTGRTAWDLYAGVGLFSTALAKRFEQVTAVEVARSAVADLECNLDRANVQARTLQTSVELFLSQQTSAPDFVIADPPRAGLGKDVVGHLVRLKPKVVVVVSCDAATMARDVAGLVTGGYRVDTMTMIDLFPHTAQLETVTKLVL